MVFCSKTILKRSPVVTLSWTKCSVCTNILITERTLYRVMNKYLNYFQPSLLKFYEKSALFTLHYGVQSSRYHFSDEQTWWTLNSIIRKITKVLNDVKKNTLWIDMLKNIKTMNFLVLWSPLCYKYTRSFCSSHYFIKCVLDLFFLQPSKDFTHHHKT